MKVIQILFIGCLLLITTLGGCQGKPPGQYSTATPEGTVRLYFDNFCELDAGKVAKLFAKEDREEVRAILEVSLNQIYSVSIERLEIEIISQSEDTAKVIARYDVVTYYKRTEEKEGGYQVAEFDLVKRGDEWLIKRPPR